MKIDGNQYLFMPYEIQINEKNIYYVDFLCENLTYCMHEEFSDNQNINN